MLSTENYHFDIEEHTHKLQLCWQGPYPIKKHLGNNTYLLVLPEGSKIHNLFHVNLLKKYFANNAKKILLHAKEAIAPGPVDPQEPDQFEVEKILTEHIYYQCPQLLVLWKGYLLPSIGVPPMGSNNIHRTKYPGLT